MRFSTPGRNESFEEALGGLGQALEARSALEGLSPTRASPAEARVLFSPAGLPLAERRALEREPGVRVEAPQGPTPGLSLLWAPEGRLSELAQRSPAWRCLWAAHRNAHLPPGPSRLMGVLNVTPDSFSDGGAFLDPERAIEHGLKLAEAGADIIDVGGESTRPGAGPVSAAEELERVLPVVSALARKARALVSIDTTKASVAQAALAEGACIVNDVSAGRFDARMLPLVAEREAGLVLMHMRGTPRDMQDAPRYNDVVREVLAHLRERAAAAWKAGIDPSRIAVDPGLGFGKRLQDNLDLIRALPELRSLGLPLVLGVSRKSFLGALSGEECAGRRGAETCAALALGAFLGAEIHRVHDVAQARAALAIAGALGQPLPRG